MQPLVAAVWVVTWECCGFQGLPFLSLLAAIMDHISFD